MPDDPGRPRGTLDTSAVIDLDVVDPSALPRESYVSSLTMAELAVGPHTTSDPEERARRQSRLQVVESTMGSHPFDTPAAQAFGRLHASLGASGRKVRGRRTVDLLVAATALAHGLPLYTR